jgi:hypothetical protein
MYINLIDYEKAFDSIDRQMLWKLLRQYGGPKKNVSTEVKEAIRSIRGGKQLTHINNITKEEIAAMRNSGTETLTKRHLQLGLYLIK